MKITANILSIKTEGGNIRVLVSYSDGDELGYLFESDKGIEDVHVAIGNVLAQKNQIVSKLDELSGAVGSKIEISDDDTQLTVTRTDESVATVSVADGKPVQIAQEAPQQEQVQP